MLVNMLPRVAISLAAAHGAVASLHSNNLAYLSPSRRHPTLAVPASHLATRAADELYTPDELEFTHGVASGDPLADSVIIWTRLAPSSNNTASDTVPEGVVPIYDHPEADQPSEKSACVEFRIASDEKLTDIVDKGTAYTTSDVDYTIKFEAAGLKPFITYYYQFNVCNSAKTSIVGRTKTVPSKDAKVDKNIKLAVYSCSNYPEGYFNAYGNPVTKDSVDYVLHLGDYIYEYKGDSSIRNPEPDRETYDLYDYRRRIATYRTDQDLLASHQKFPWIPVWDDHEVADNSWREGSVNSDGEVFAKRKQAAVRAYFEWMPIRQVEMDDSLRIWRSFSLGTLADLMMLDTRQYSRDLTVLGGFAGIGGNSGEVEKLVNLDNRTIMGFNQEAWFYNQLSQSSNRGAAWRLVGQQVVFSHVTFGFFTNEGFNRDQWDGYLANRRRVFGHLYDNQINNTIIMSGDSHASWVSDLAWVTGDEGDRPYDKNSGDGAIGVELAGSAVSSKSPIGNVLPNFLTNLASAWLVNKNDELQWQDLYFRGYYEMDIGYDSLTATFFGIPDVKTRNTKEDVIATFVVNNGENKLARNPTVGGGTAKSGSLKNGKVSA
ncbi:hypothetical protein V2G26_017266 [Clonostachys chloroleuca]